MNNDTTPADKPRTTADYAGDILLGLQTHSHIYGGTVDPVTVADRRRRNKAARRSRRINRLAAGALIASAVSVGLYSNTGSAHADTRSDATFLALMAEDGFTTNSGSTGLLQDGHHACVDIDTVAPADNTAADVAEADIIAADMGLNVDRAITFIADTVATLCPWNMPTAPTSGRPSAPNTTTAA